MRRRRSRIEGVSLHLAPYAFTRADETLFPTLRMVSDAPFGFGDGTDAGGGTDLRICPPTGIA
jgi:hypothetical protein